jgi:hypothetical protein
MVTIYFRDAIRAGINLGRRQMDQPFYLIGIAFLRQDQSVHKK